MLHGLISVVFQLCPLKPWGHPWGSIFCVFSIGILVDVYFGGRKLIKINLWDAFPKSLSLSLILHPLMLLNALPTTHHLKHIFGWSSSALYPLEHNLHEVGAWACNCALTIYKTGKHRVDVHWKSMKERNEKRDTEWLLTTAGHSHLHSDCVKKREGDGKGAIASWEV